MLYRLICGLYKRLEIKKNKLNFDDEWLKIIFKDLLELRRDPNEIIL